MAFCAFDDSAALFDSTPVENMFITEYMLRAPGDFVKVYLYALMLCYHPDAAHVAFLDGQGSGYDGGRRRARVQILGAGRAGPSGWRQSP